MAEAAWPNLAAMFFDQAERLGDKPLFWAKRDGAYEAMSWRQAAAKAGALAAGLEALGVVPATGSSWYPRTAPNGPSPTSPS